MPVDPRNPFDAARPLDNPNVPHSSGPNQAQMPRYRDHTAPIETEAFAQAQAQQREQASIGHGGTASSGRGFTSPGPSGSIVLAILGEIHNLEGKNHTLISELFRRLEGLLSPAAPPSVGGACGTGPSSRSPVADELLEIARRLELQGRMLIELHERLEL